MINTLLWQHLKKENKQMRKYQGAVLHEFGFQMLPAQIPHHFLIPLPWHNLLAV